MTVGRLTVVAVVLLAAAGAVGPVAGGAPAVDRAVVPQVDVATDSVVITVSVQPDGTGVWEVAYRKRLDDENATASFEAYRERVDERPVTVTGPFRDEMAAAAQEAAAETGREMRIENVTVTARRTSVPEEFGLVTVRFEWTGFAETNGDRLRAGPALSGFFLTNETTLLVAWPPAYERVEVTPTPDERRNHSVVWSGPMEFASGEPVTVLEASGSGRPPSILLAGLAVAGLGLLAAGGVLVSRRFAGGETPVDGGPGTDDPTADDTAVSTDRKQTETPGEREAETGPREVPSELLSNEERLLELLERRGGRVKQQQVVEAFDWSETKTSQVVNDLQDAGEVEVYRIGRENVVALPGEMDV